MFIWPVIIEDPITSGTEKVETPFSLFWVYGSILKRSGADYSTVWSGSIHLSSDKCLCHLHFLQWSDQTSWGKSGNSFFPIVSLCVFPWHPMTFNFRSQWSDLAIFRPEPHPCVCNRYLQVWKSGYTVFPIIIPQLKLTDAMENRVLIWSSSNLT